MGLLAFILLLLIVTGSCLDDQLSSSNDGEYELTKAYDPYKPLGKKSITRKSESILLYSDGANQPAESVSEQYNFQTKSYTTLEHGHQQPSSKRSQSQHIGQNTFKPTSNEGDADSFDSEYEAPYEPTYEAPYEAPYVSSR